MADTSIQAGEENASRQKNLICTHCGSPFIRYLAHIKSTSKVFCSKICKDAHPRPRKLVELNCEICRSPFLRAPSQAAKGNRRYCSAKCRCAGLSIRYSAEGRKGPVFHGEDSPVWRPDLSKTCPVCGTPFRSTNKSCSPQCARKLQSQAKLGIQRPHEHKYRKCACCGKLYRRLKGSSGFFYCSSECYQRFSRTSRPHIGIVAGLRHIGYEVEIEKSWDWLRNPATGRMLRVDIYLPDHSVVIEYDGKQHFDPNIRRFANQFENIQHRDRVKNHLIPARGLRLKRLSSWPVDWSGLLRFIQGREE